MLRIGSRIKIVSGAYSGKYGTVYDVDMTLCPEITVILDIDKDKEEDVRYSYVRAKNVIEV